MSATVDTMLLSAAEPDAAPECKSREDTHEQRTRRRPQAVLVDNSVEIIDFVSEMLSKEFDIVGKFCGRSLKLSPALLASSIMLLSMRSSMVFSLHVELLSCLKSIHCLHQRTALHLAVNCAYGK